MIHFEMVIQDRKNTQDDDDGLSALVAVRFFAIDWLEGAKK